jgi:hypothetical protein
MSTNNSTHDHETDHETPFDPRTANPDYRVTIRYTSKYSEGIQFVEGDVNPHYAESGRRVAIYDDGKGRTLVLLPSGRVYSRKTERTFIGAKGRVLDIRPRDGLEGKHD